MNIQLINSYLVYPGKNIDNPPSIKMANLPLQGRLYTVLLDIFNNSNNECDINIRFEMGEDGSRNNEARNLIIDYINNPSLDKGELIALRLRGFTTKKPNLGLLFIIFAKDGNRWKILLSRFPVDTGIVAEEGGNNLQLAYIERIFMKSTKRYKAAVFEDSSFDNFWDGFVADKQVKDGAQYWVHDFLDSEIKTTSKTGSKTFGRALRDASRKAPDIQTKTEIVSLSNLLFGHQGEVLSPQETIDTHRLSETANEIIVAQFPRPEMASHHFEFDIDVFSNEVKFQSVELNNGAIMMAPPESFEDVFKREKLDNDANIYRFTSEGEIVDELIKGRK